MHAHAHTATLTGMIYVIYVSRSYQLYTLYRIAAEEQEIRDYELAMRLAQVSSNTYVWKLCVAYIRRP